MRNHVKRLISCMLIGFMSFGVIAPMNISAFGDGFVDSSNSGKNDTCNNPSEVAPEDGSYNQDTLPGYAQMGPGADEVPDEEAGQEDSGEYDGGNDENDDGDGDDGDGGLIFRVNGEEQPLIDNLACAGKELIGEMSDIDKAIISRIPNINSGSKICGLSLGFFSNISGNRKENVEKYTWTAWIKERETDKSDMSLSTGNYHGFTSEWYSVWLPYEEEIRALNDGRFPENRDYIYPVTTKEGVLDFWVHKAGYYDVLGDPFYPEITLYGYQTFNYIVRDVREEKDKQLCGFHYETEYYNCHQTSDTSSAADQGGGQTVCDSRQVEVIHECPIYYYYEETQSTQVAETVVVEDLYATEIGRLPNFGMEEQTDNEDECIDVNEEGFEFDDVYNKAEDFYYERGGLICLKSNSDFEYKYTTDGTEGLVNVYYNLEVKDGFYTNMANGYACIPDDDGNCIDVPEGTTPDDIDPGDGGNGDNGGGEPDGPGPGEEGYEITDLLPPAIDITIDIEEGNPQQELDNVRKFVHLNKNVKNRLNFDFYRDKANRTDSVNN